SPRTLPRTESVSCIRGRCALHRRTAVCSGSAPEPGRALAPAGFVRAATDSLRPVQAVVLVGGEGTRLRPLTLETPKPMVPIMNMPFLERTLRRIKEAGI